MNKINESKYRSPKWMRKFLDFEINTGEDIKGNVSKKQLRREEKQRKEDLINQWKKRWESINVDLFKEFFRESFPDDNLKTYTHDGMSEIYNRWIGDFEIWNKYDIWLKKKQQKEEDRKKVEKELRDLINRINTDFNSNKYDDKFSTPKENGENTFHYTFENGDTFILRGNTIVYDFGNQRITYTVGLIFRNAFVELANKIINSNHTSRGRSKSNSGQQSRPRPKPKENKYSSHPKGDLYQRLKDTVDLRKKQLSEMPKNHPDRTVLENELTAAETKLKKMQSDYKFENLVSFNGFV